MWSRVFRFGDDARITGYCEIQILSRGKSMLDCGQADTQQMCYSCHSG